MGLLTLGDFRADLESALGNLGIAEPRLTRWVNTGYFDLTGSVLFEFLVREATPNTVASTEGVEAPSGAQNIDLVRDTTTPRLLNFLPKAEYFRRDGGTGAPKHWTWHGDQILLFPIPDGVYALRVIYRASPTALAATGDLTVLPEIWDPVVFMLAAHHAFLALGQEQRSIVWLSRAVTYIQSRLTEDDLGRLSGLKQRLEQMREN